MSRNRTIPCRRDDRGAPDFARVIPYRLKPGQRHAAIATVEGMKAGILALPGLRHFTCVPGGDGGGCIVSAVESAEISDASADRVRALRGRMAPHLAEMPTPRGGEVVGDCRTAGAPSGRPGHGPAVRPGP